MTTCDHGVTLPSKRSTHWTTIIHCRERLAAAAIQERCEARIRFTTLAAWHGLWAQNKRRSALLGAAATRLRNHALSAAFNKLKANVEDAK